MIQAHRTNADAVVPLAVAGAIPVFYPSSITNATTRAAAQAFVSAYVSHVSASAGLFVLAIDPRVQDTVFTPFGVTPSDWAALFVDLATVARAANAGIRVLPDLAGDNHSSYLPGAWLTTAAAAADGIGIEETAPLLSTILSDVDWFYSQAAGRKVWILASSFSTWTGADSRAHGTETQQADYFNNLLSNLVIGYSTKVEAWVQGSLADAGVSSTWGDHLGLSTPALAADKPALPVVRQFVAGYPPYHTIFEKNRTIEASLGTSFDLGVYSVTDFDYLEWKGAMDLSQATAMRLHFTVSSADGYPGYLLQAGGAWRQVTTSEVDILPWVVNGKVALKLMVPSAALTGMVQVLGLQITKDVNASLPDVCPPLVDNMEVAKRIRLDFTDSLDPVTAQSAANYVIRDPLGRVLPVLGTTLSGGRSVFLSTGPQKSLTYRLFVSGVKDDAGNAMAADTLTFKGIPLAGPQPTPYRPYDLGASSAPGGVQIRLEAAEDPGPVAFSIYDVSGRRIRTASWDGSGRSWSWLWEGEADQGGHAASGVYFIRVTGRLGAETVRCLLTR